MHPISMHLPVPSPPVFPSSLPCALHIWKQFNVSNQTKASLPFKKPQQTKSTTTEKSLASLPFSKTSSLILEAMEVYVPYSILLCPISLLYVH